MTCILVKKEVRLFNVSLYVMMSAIADADKPSRVGAARSLEILRRLILLLIY